LLTEHPKQTAFPHAPHLQSSPPNPNPSTSIAESSLPPASPTPQSSQLDGIASTPRTGGEGAPDKEGDGVVEEGAGAGRFQKLWRERWMVGWSFVRDGAGAVTIWSSVLCDCELLRRWAEYRRLRVCSAVERRTYDKNLAYTRELWW